MKPLIAFLCLLFFCTPLFSETMAEKADRLIEEREFKQAKEVLEKLVEAEPENDRFLYQLGMCHFYLGDDVRAQAFLKKAIAINPDVADYYNYLGASYYYAGDKAAAKKYYLACIKLSEADHRPFEMLGHIFKDAEDYDQALAYYRKACSINGKAFFSFLNLGVLSFNTGDFPAAEKALETAVGLKPSHYDALRYLIRTKFRLGKHKEGEQLKTGLIALWEKSDNAELKKTQHFVFDDYKLDEYRIWATEIFKKEGDLYYYYRFIVHDKEGNLLKTVNLESSFATVNSGTPFILGSDEFTNGRRIHRTYSIGFKRVPDYPTMKAYVEKVLRGELEAGATGVYGE